MRVFKDVDLLEQLGSGIPRILKTYNKECFLIRECFLNSAFLIVYLIHNDVFRVQSETDLKKCCSQWINAIITHIFMRKIKGKFGWDNHKLGEL